MRNFGRRLPELQESAARHKNIHSQTADVTDAESLQRLYHDAQTARGSFGIVVANVGAAGFERDRYASSWITCRALTVRGHHSKISYIPSESERIDLK